MPETDPMSLALGQARETLDIEARAVRALMERLGDDFRRAVELLLGLRGRVVTSGIGKSGAVARKIASTLASTGTPAFFMHPAEAQHGDLGMVTADDVVLAFSNSGETDEVTVILPWLKRVGAPVIAVCGRRNSTLAREAVAILDASVEREACPLGLAPTASAMAQMAVGDALAMAVMAARGFTVEDYARTHPAGALGRKVLLRVADLMHSGEANPTVPASASVLDALMVMSNSPIRGAVSVLEEDSRLAGFFTDGDFRSLMRREGDWGAVMRRPVAEVMTRRPTTTSPETMAAEAALLMQRRQFDNLPVLDAEGRVVGMLDIQDLVGAGLA